MFAWLNARCFLLGLVVSMASLSVLGALIVPPDLTRDFVRFHTGIGIDHNFFPTAHDIRAILDAAAAKDDKPVVTVIVGGTSVFQGTSQSEPLIWTELLQKNLGSGFRVINLAQRAGRPNDFGNFAAEMLIKENKPVIYVCDSMTPQFTIPIEASFYLKTVFDAWQRGYLLDWPARDRKMSDAYWSPLPKYRLDAWGALADRWLNFNGFWSYVAFEYGGTIWDKYRILDSIRPLREARDPEPPPQFYVDRGYPQGALNEQEVKTALSQIFPPGDSRWKIVRDGVDEQMPLPLRALTLTVVDINSPYHLNQLTEDEKAAYLAQADAMAALLKTMGFHDTIVVAKDFVDADYSDRVHLSVNGGRKLADRLAPEIVRMAAELGYEK
jgi:hypothetical protein